MSDPAQESKEHTGYKVPPTASQFKKGQSGNPNGRPKGSKNNKTVFENLAATLIDGKLPGGDDAITLREGVIAKLASKALAGDARSMNKFIDTMQSYDDQNASYCREAELLAVHQIFKLYRIAQLNAGLSFSAREIKLIASYLNKVDEEFKKFGPQINAMFDKHGFARPETLEASDDNREAVATDDDSAEHMDKN